jgi:hypothetical protein
MEEKVPPPKKKAEAGSKPSFSKPYGITSQKAHSHCSESIRSDILKELSGRLHVFPALFSGVKIDYSEVYNLLKARGFFSLSSVLNTE